MSGTHPLVTEYGDVPPISESTKLGEEEREARQPNPIAVRNIFNRYFEWLEEQGAIAALLVKEEESA